MKPYTNQNRVSRVYLNIFGHTLTCMYTYIHIFNNKENMGELGDGGQKHEFKSDIMIFILKTYFKKRKRKSVTTE